MNTVNYLIERDTPDFLVLRDLGPWDQHMTITNAAEEVVQELAPRLDGRRLYYYDSSGSLDELVVRDNKFTDFAPGGPKE
jgi:hypothetical protein